MADEKNRQMIQYHFFATKEQAEQIEKRMHEIGVRNKCAYFRKMAIDGYYICVDLADVKEMVRLLRIYGNNLNQLARRANEGGSIYRNDVEDLQHEMHELWKMMRQILQKFRNILPLRKLFRISSQLRRPYADHGIRRQRREELCLKLLILRIPQQKQFLPDFFTDHRVLSPAFTFTI